MLPLPYRVAEAFPALGLAELDAAAALRERVDTKYVIGLADLERLAGELRATHAVLEIDGRRAFRYRTTYFDTAELRAFRDHVQERRRRYKCRSREYVDSGLCTFEVKLKGSRGRTVKHRMAYDRARRDELSEPALSFLRDCLERSYGRGPDGELKPALAVAYTRVTFAAPALGERVTCDFDLAFSAPDGTSGRLAEDAVIVESKSPRGNAVADRALRRLGARPEGGCSKYVLGVGFTNPRVKSNRLRPLLRRHFRAAPAAAVALAVGAGAPAAAADAPRAPASSSPAAAPTVHLRSSKAIRDEPKVPARLTVGGRSYRVEVEWRGQASQLYPKKSYAVETRRRVRLLGMPRERDWVLNAAYADPSLLRDVVAHAAARRMGLPASRARPVELRLNGRRRGVYVLMEQPELSRSRLRAEALLELTEPRKLDRGDESFPSASGLSVRHVEPDEADKKKAVAARRALEALERSLGAPGWRAHLDERSAVDYLLHAELLGNQDAFHASTFVHLRGDGRLAMGPVWDFDLSAGNVVERALARPDAWMLAGRPWPAALLADPGFRAALAARWRELRAGGLVEALLRTIERHERALRAPARRNFTRWPTLGTQVFRNQTVHQTHAAAVAALKDWLVRRAAWMDGAL
jgi:CotH kinase protein/VTC domain